MELCSMLCGSLDGRAVWGRMDMCIWLSPFPVRLKLSHFLIIGCTPIQNKKFKKQSHKLLQVKQSTFVGIPNLWGAYLCLCCKMPLSSMKGNVQFYPRVMEDKHLHCSLWKKNQCQILQFKNDLRQHQ